MSDLELFSGLLRHYSPTGSEAEAVTFLVSQMQELGYQAAIDGAGNAVGSRGEGPQEILLLGHIDTVPGFIDVREEGDLLYGRGAADAKGPLACFTAAAARVAVSAGWRLTVIGAVGEESDSRGALYIRDRYAPQALIIGEPSKWDRITLGFKGSLWVGYDLKQPMAHTAAKVAGACEVAVEFWNALLAWCASLNPTEASPFNQLTPSLRSMQSASDGFYETVHLHINLRLPLGMSLQFVKDRLDEMKGEADITLEDGIEAYRAEKNTPLVRAFLSAVRSAGGQPSFSLKTGTSDMNIVAPLWKCPAVAYGPGDSNLDHTPHEHISMLEYQKSITVLREVLKQMMSNSPNL